MPEIFSIDSQDITPEQKEGLEKRVEEFEESIKSIAQIRILVQELKKEKGIQGFYELCGRGQSRRKKTKRLLSKKVAEGLRSSN